MKEHVKRGNGEKVEFDFLAVASANGDGGSVVGLSGAGVVGDGIDDIERAVDEDGGLGRIFGSEPGWMNGVPRVAGDGEKVSAGVERRKFVGAQVIGDFILKANDLADSGAVVFAPERDHGLAYGVAALVEYLAEEKRGGCELQDEAFGIEISAGDDGGGELLVLVVVGADVSTLGAAQGKFSGGDVEGKVSVVSGELGLDVFGILDFGEEDAGLREMRTGFGILDESGDPVGLRSELGGGGRGGQEQREDGE